MCLYHKTASMFCIGILTPRIRNDSKNATTSKNDCWEHRLHTNSRFRERCEQSHACVSHICLCAAVERGGSTNAVSAKGRSSTTGCEHGRGGCKGDRVNHTNEIRLSVIYPLPDTSVASQLDTEEIVGDDRARSSGFSAWCTCAWQHGPRVPPETCGHVESKC